MTAADVLEDRRAWAIVCADVLEGLATLPDRSVHCVVTSPPYFALRDYGTAEWRGGNDPDCTHKVRPPGSGVATIGIDGGTATQGHQQEGYRDACRRCGAVRVDRQIGLEPSPGAFVETMVRVFREVRRVLRKDGTLWLNLGDSYASSGGHRGQGVTGQRADRGNADAQNHAPQFVPPGFKAKDLIGIPWRTAFALQADGWWLRSEITWCKKSVMPEPVHDRPATATEKVFLLTPRARYYYDPDAVREVTGNEADPDEYAKLGGDWADYAQDAAEGRGHAVSNQRPTKRNAPSLTHPLGRNMRNYWLLGPDPLEVEFCTACQSVYPTGAYRRLAQIEITPKRHARICPCGKFDAWLSHFATFPPEVPRRAILAGCPKDGVVLDPFSGAGTSVMVALRLGRRGIGIDLNPQYVVFASKRIEQDAPMFNAP